MCEESHKKINESSVKYHMKMNELWKTNKTSALHVENV